MTRRRGRVSRVVDAVGLWSDVGIAQQKVTQEVLRSGVPMTDAEIAAWHEANHEVREELRRAVGRRRGARRGGRR